MAYWIEDSDDDLLNLEKAHQIFIEDWGPDYCDRFRVMARIGSSDYLIRNFESMEEAKDLRQEIFQKIGTK